MVYQNIRFMANNYVDSTTLLSYSSQLTAFPLSNIYEQSRSRAAKFGGNFTIDATNNKIYINDGANKTITLTSGNYTYSALAAHVQTQLNASSSAWTCTYDFSGGTYKFTIGHTGSATIRLTQTTAAAWDTLGYTGAADRTGTSFVADEQRNHTHEEVVFDFLAARAVDFAAIITKVDSPFRLSSTGTLKLQLNNVNSWGAPAQDVSFTAHDRGVMKFLDATLSSTSYRYARLYLRDRLNTCGPEGFQWGHVYLGDYATFSTTTVEPGYTKKLVDPSSFIESEAGVRYWLRRPKYRDFSDMRIANIEAAERRVVEGIYEDVGRAVSFYASLDPTLAISTELQELTAYVNFEDDPRFIHLFRDYYAMNLSLREAV